MISSARHLWAQISREPICRGRVPIGVQIVGQRYREDLCLDAAAAIERATGVMSDVLIEELEAARG